MTQPARIEVCGLTKTFGDVHAVDDLSFVAEPGVVTGFLGPNGAGKTTTLRILVGLADSDAGSATIGGRRYRDLPRPTDTVGAALEAAGFHPARAGRDHLRVLCTVNGYPSARAEEVLELVGLTAPADRSVGGYSLGMRQRLAIATALLGDPEVLVLDEPANGLDPDGIVWMRRLLRDLAAQGRTVLVSSHVLTEMQQLVDEVVVIHHGRLVRQGSLDELTTGDAEVVSVISPAADQLAALLTTSHVGTIERTGDNRLRVAGMGPTDIGRLAYQHGIELHWLASERGSLEQVFFALTGSEARPSDAQLPEAG